MKRTPLYAAIAGLAVTAALPQTYAQEVIEEVVVTGSFIAGSPEDAAVPVDVLSIEELTEVGSPSINELVRNLGIASGNIGESNQFQGSSGGGLTGASSINLRGLGPARTLVLINGYRQTASANFGVDIAAIPSSALKRIEVLKDGAAALYGSDAISGVVNFITDNDFEGFQIGGNYQDVRDAGDYDANLKYGFATDNSNFVISAEYRHRDRLSIEDRDFAVPTQEENPEGGFSNIGQPATLIVNTQGIVQDPQCEALGGFLSLDRDIAPGQTRCRFQFTPFDNLTEESDEYKVFTSYNLALSDTMNLHVEALWHTVKSDYYSSPSFPPQTFTSADRFAPSNNPGVAAFIANNPALAIDPSSSISTIGRVIGVQGRDGEGFHDDRQTDTYRLATKLDGTLFDDSINYEVSLAYSKVGRNIIVNDTSIQNYAFAINGFGGDRCDRATAIANNTPGQNGCLFLNPLSNAIPTLADGSPNLQFIDGVTNNSQEVLDYVLPTYDTETVTDLYTLDVVFSGETGIELSGGNIGWAAGIQGRRDGFERQTDAIANPDINPCPFNDPQIGVLIPGVAAQVNNCLANGGVATGVFSFVTGSPETDFARGTYGVFTEFALPVTDDLNVQLALRYETYEAETGSTLDPKIAAKWQVTDSVALRGSVSTTFRGPPQEFLQGRNTALAFLAPTGAFKAVVTSGNPDLDPESATAYNFGVIFDSPIGDGNLYASLDYFRFEIEDPFQTESADQILTTYLDAGCLTDLTQGVCPTLAPQVILATPGNIRSLARVETNILNGGDLDTAGVDLNVEYSMPLFEGDAAFGFQGTQTFTFESDDFNLLSGVKVQDGAEFVGRLNDGDPFLPKPRTKLNVYAKYNQGIHSANIYVRYIGGYNDTRAPREFSAANGDVNGQPNTGPVINGLDKIDSFTTIDLNYGVVLMDDRLRVSASIFNVTDRDPPQAATDLNYDAFTHSAFGRLIKVGATYNFDL